MKKNLSLLSGVLLFGLPLPAQQPAAIVQHDTTDAPQVTITVDEVGTDFVTLSFDKNDACAYYDICSSAPPPSPTMEDWSATFHVPVEELVQWWGVRIHEDTTYTWHDMNPGTEYTLYAVPSAADSTYSDLVSVTVTTGLLGGDGPAELTIEVSDVTDSSAHIVCTPNENTSLFYDGLVETGFLNEAGADSIKAIFMSDPMQPLYETDDWVWPGLSPNTSYTFVAFGMNINGEWSETAMEEFTTAAAPCPTEMTVEVNDITDSSAHIVCIPDKNTSLFYDGVVETGFLNEAGPDSIKSVFMSDPAQPHYETDDRVWSGLSPGTDYTFMAFRMNVHGTWDTTVTQEFATTGLAGTGIASRRQGQRPFTVTPMPNNGSFTVDGEGLEGCRLRVYNLGGQLRGEFLLHSSANRISAGLPAGGYVLHLSDKEGKTAGTRKMTTY